MLFRNVGTTAHYLSLLAGQQLLARIEQIILAAKHKK
jgi:hypothetical protein